MNDDPTNLLETPAVSDAQDAPASPAAANPLAEQVYQQLKNDIFSFRLFPGDRFSENGIAQHYGVSRTPMRDGLFRLQR
jgi:DNA-binding GntR family transcriptional regulator